MVNFEPPEPAFRRTGIFLRVPVLSIHRLRLSRSCVSTPYGIGPARGHACVGVTIPKGFEDLQHIINDNKRFSIAATLTTESYRRHFAGAAFWVKRLPARGCYSMTRTSLSRGMERDDYVLLLDHLVNEARLRTQQAKAAYAARGRRCRKHPLRKHIRSLPSHLCCNYTQHHWVVY